MRAQLLLPTPRFSHLPTCPRSDLTFDQFASKMLMSGVSVAEVQARAAAGAQFVPPSRRNGRKLAQTVPNELDWRAKGKVPPPRDQGGCGRWVVRRRWLGGLVGHKASMQATCLRPYKAN